LPRILRVTSVSEGTADFPLKNRLLALAEEPSGVSNGGEIAAREDGGIGEDEQTPGGFYLRNRDPELRTLTLGDPGVVTVQACFLEKGPCAADHAVSIDTWVQLLADPDMAEEQLGWFWYGAGLAPHRLTLQDGVVVEIVEQYLP